MKKNMIELRKKKTNKLSTVSSKRDLSEKENNFNNMPSFEHYII
jgi:hypothetical protein